MHVRGHTCFKGIVRVLIGVIWCPASSADNGASPHITQKKNTLTQLFSLYPGRARGSAARWAAHQATPKAQGSAASAAAFGGSGGGEIARRGCICAGLAPPTSGPVLGMAGILNHAACLRPAGGSQH